MDVGRPPDIDREDQDSDIYPNDDDGSIQSDNRIEDEDCDRQPDIDQKDGNGETKLYKAAERGNIDECRNLLSRGANINCTDNGGASPLMIAAEKGHLPTCVLLTESGADVHLANKYGNTSLSWASWTGSYDVVNHLIKQQANINNINNDGVSPLMGAAANGHLPVCVLLTDFGADIDLTNHQGESALSLAARLGRYAVAQHLVNLGADCNTVKKDDLLIYGSTVGDLSMCTKLVRSGAALNQNIDDERHPLFISAKNGHYELSQWMIQEGADDRSCLDPLLYCYAKYGDHQLCRDMLNRGADPSYPGCLQIAIELYHTDVAQLLIEHPKSKVNQVGKCSFHFKSKEQIVTVFSLGI